MCGSHWKGCASSQRRRRISTLTSHPQAHPQAARQSASELTADADEQTKVIHMGFMLSFTRCAAYSQEPNIIMILTLNELSVNKAKSNHLQKI